MESGLLRQESGLVPAMDKMLAVAVMQGPMMMPQSP